jgi:Protein of unknown function (DUF1203)
MSRLRFVALPTATVLGYQAGGVDAYGRVPERRTAAESGLPCRHCLSDIELGEDYLTLAHRPFASVQPYAETGPIFLHAEPCSRHPETPDPPASLLERSEVLLRGYGTDERIVYGTGGVVPADRIVERAVAIFDDLGVAFVDVRSASNNCFQCRIVPDGGV